MHHYFLEKRHLGIQVYWIYLVGICCVVFHFCNGPRNLAHHWGLTVSPRSQRLLEDSSAVTLLALGLALLAARVMKFSALRPAWLPRLRR